MARVVTSDGVLVVDKINGVDMTLEEAEQSAAERNKRAEEMELKVRYEAKK